MTYILFEDAGKLAAGRVLSQAETSMQVELPSGKRQKIKASQALLPFGAPDPEELLAWAQAQQDGIDLDLLWEFAPHDEFSFSLIADDYYGGKPTPQQKAAVLLRLHGAPHYFQRRGKGQFRKASQETVQAALVAIARKQAQQRQIEEDAHALVQGRCPDSIGAKLYTLLFKPDRNSLEYRALALAVKQSGQGALQLLRQAGAIGSPWHFHMQRFLLEHFPKGTGFPEVPLPEADAEGLPLAAVKAFSIDDSATTEIDDALSVQPVDGGGLRVGIHIAAPALALLRDSAWDQAARARMSTVYMPGDKITMLPDDLVTLFTLAEGSSPPAVSIYFTLDASLAIVAHETCIERVPIVANLRHDLLDDQVTEESLNRAVPSQTYPFASELAHLWRIAQKLKAGREAVRGRPERAGGVDYTFRVTGLEPNEATARVAIVPRRRGSPLDLIVAELMILANATWGGWLAELGLPAIYRSQSGMGINLRTRMGTKPAPHQGLGVPQYCWCTSPLRRYTDLLNQSQIIAAVRHGRAALLGAPYKPKDAQLYAIVGAFEDAYKAYAEFQNGMERYWTLRYLQQESITEGQASVMRDGLVRVEGLPLVLQALGAQDLPRGTGVRVQFGQADLITLEQPCKVVEVLQDRGTAAGVPISAEEPAEEEDTPALVTGLHLAVDEGEVEVELESGTDAQATAGTTTSAA
ncbi:ribonuclease catalytic domain-containing protein [Thiomonas sp. FB-Cd]|uniref:ribonuclease catalytic domain-containing protein n=1 Tax=Thiomonas sp. FB-Cd TaxID=1158292 RepID=UPI0004DED195|nr:RNB domain-containing ribonuclease [Thiomonas sp. FB-Cd]